MKMISKVILTAAAIIALAAPAMAADKLIVKDAAGTADVFKVDDSGVINGGAKFSSAGWLGLGGNFTPLAAFHGKGTTSPSSQLLMSRTDSAASGAGFLAYHNNVTAAQCTAAGVPTACCTGAGSGPTCPASTLPVNATRLGYFLFGGWASNGTSALNAAGMTARAEGVWTDTSVPAYFTFETSGAATGRTEKFRITGEGNIVAANLGASAPGDLATNVTNGFLYIPSVSGALTTCSTATTYPGHVPVWFDTTNAKICTCQGATLKCTAVLN